MKKTVITPTCPKEQVETVFHSEEFGLSRLLWGLVQKPRGQRIYPATNKNKVHAVLDKFEADKLGQKHSQSAKAGAMCGTTSFRSRRSN
ncbi:Uncharacterised protein [Corynebacterium diphtheriae]|nr:Uncharacterised protein [Corynebacterium diphtheriae]